jgi:Rrf2 family protein
LSKRAQIPANYLAKILLVLRNGGLLDTVRGSSGGYHLSKAASEILLIDVVELFEGARSRPSCVLFHSRACSDLTPCAAHHRFRQTRKAYLHFLETTTIAMLAKHAAAT